MRNIHEKSVSLKIKEMESYNKILYGKKKKILYDTHKMNKKLKVWRVCREKKMDTLRVEVWINETFFGEQLAIGRKAEDAFTQWAKNPNPGFISSRCREPLTSVHKETCSKLFLQVTLYFSFFF